MASLKPRKSPEEEDSLYFKAIAPWVFWAIFIALLYAVWLIFKAYLLPFFMALICYLFFRKPYLWLLRAFRDSKNTASILISVIILVVLILPSFFLIKSLFEESILAINYIQKWANETDFQELYKKNSWIQTLITTLDIKTEHFQEQILKLSTNFGSIILASSRDFLSGILGFLFTFLIMIVSLFFLFREGDKIPVFIYSLLPFPDHWEREIGSRLFDVLDVMVKGTVIISLLQGTFLGLYFWFFGLSTPVLYGALGAMVSLLPIFGTIPVWLPGAIFLYWNGNVASAIVLGLLAYLTYLILENIVKPWLLDKKLPLHPLFLFLSILGGVIQFGIQGFVLGPFIVTAFVILLELLKAWKEKNGFSGY